MAPTDTVFCVSRRPTPKQRLRSVILVSALGAVACGGQALREGGDGEENSRGGRLNPRLTPPPSTGDVTVGNIEPRDGCCNGELLGAGAANDDDYGFPGGAGGASSGDSDEYVGIR